MHYCRHSDTNVHGGCYRTIDVAQSFDCFPIFFKLVIVSASGTESVSKQGKSRKHVITQHGGGGGTVGDSLLIFEDRVQGFVFPNEAAFDHAIPFLEVDWWRRVSLLYPHNSRFNLRHNTTEYFNQSFGPSCVLCILP